MAKHNRPDFNDAPTLTTKPPTSEDALVEIINKQRGLPMCMPLRPIDAAHWWIGMQKPMSRYEFPSRVAVQGTGNTGQRWETPYINRLAVNLQKFLRLKKPDHDFIIAACDDGCKWSGDEMQFFHGLYEETMIKKDVGVDKYRKRAAKAARGLLSGFITK